MNPISADPESTAREDRQAVARSVVCLIGCALLGEALWALCPWPGVRVLGACLLESIGAFSLGALGGLVFGIPRPDERTPTIGTETSTEQTMRVNTNLVEISDWLTKSLVGAGLTQIHAIPEALSRFGNAYGQSVGGPSIAVFLLVAFVTLGFIGGYLGTRMWLQRLLYSHDRIPRDLQKISNDGTAQADMSADNGAQNAERPGQNEGDNYSEEPVESEDKSVPFLASEDIERSRTSPPLSGESAGDLKSGQVGLAGNPTGHSGGGPQ